LTWRYQRLAPHTLPAHFFDPPTTPLNLWDKAAGWVHDHLGLGP
jgi:hypothetical protein